MRKRNERHQRGVDILWGTISLIEVILLPNADRALPPFRPCSMLEIEVRNSTALALKDIDARVAQQHWPQELEYEVQRESRTLPNDHQTVSFKYFIIPLGRFEELQSPGKSEH